MIILGLDPGNIQSAFIIFDTDKKILLVKELLENNECVKYFKSCQIIPDMCVIEQIASYGMPVGESVFETAVWSGRFWQIFIDLNWKVDRIKRNMIKNILCGSSRAKDINIRQRLIDIFGEPGTKKNPGILYGVKKDLWSALAVIIAWDIQKKKKNKEV